MTTQSNKVIQFLGKAIFQISRTINVVGLVNLAEAYYNRGLAYKEQGNKAEVVADFEKFITLTNNPLRIEITK